MDEMLDVASRSEEKNDGEGDAESRASEVDRALPELGAAAATEN
jgi:hypothetical protein